ncbi:DUF5681 domain-containing protein [Cobetia amphilecti]|uniref:DUF5681 domain-containing protein n=1 Tax=Cobetia amphilecti TaxID=1055104 RepID=UPI0032976EB1
MATRTERGTFKKGQSGNPAGRPKAQHTALKRALEQHGASVAGVVVERAMAGDMAAARLILERLHPPVKASTAPVTLEVPDGASLATQAELWLQAAAQGRVPADVAASMVSALGGAARIVEVTELAQRLEALEAAHGE